MTITEMDELLVLVTFLLSGCSPHKICGLNTPAEHSFFCFVGFFSSLPAK